MTTITKKPFPLDPNAAGTQPDVRPDPHAPKSKPASVAVTMRAALGLVQVIAGTLQDGELAPSTGARYKMTGDRARMLLSTYISSARTIVNALKEN